MSVIPGIGHTFAAQRRIRRRRWPLNGCIRWLRFIFLKGFGLEVALFLGTAMGCFLYTDVEASWEQLQLYATENGQPFADQAGPAAQSLDATTFPHEVNPETLFEVRQMAGLAR